MLFPKSANLKLKFQKAELARKSDILGWLLGEKPHQRSAAFQTNNWEEIYATPGSIQLEQQKRDTPAGALYDQEVQLSYPGLRPESLMNVLADLGNERFAIRLLANSGLTVIIGNVDAFAQLEWKYSSTANATTFNFKLTDTQPAGVDVQLNQFFINHQGNLIQAFENHDTFTLQGADLLVEGPTEENYELQNGFLQNG